VKIAAPCSDPSEVEPLCRAGADELYCGVYDRGWAGRWGLAGGWPNRRGPGPGNLGSLEALDAVCEGAHDSGATVSLTLNSTYYAPQQEEAVLRLAADAVDAGVDALIVGTPALIRTLRRRHPKTTLVASSLCGVRNRESVGFFGSLGVERFILGRQLSLEEIHGIQLADDEYLYEAFVYSDACAFDESCCHTAHQLPGWSAPYCLGPWAPRGGDGSDAERAALRRHGEHLEALATGGYTETGLPLGPCGLCALPELSERRVSTVKVVGREAHPYRKVRSVQMVRHVLDALHSAGEAEAKKRALALRGDPDGCRSGLHCYYPEVRPKE